jgi:hypothetical protein
MIPPEIIAWVTEKIESHHWAGVIESRRVTHEWRRHTGGRIMWAGLTASIAPSQEWSLRISAQGVEPQYVAAAQNGLFSVLLSQSWAPVLRCAVCLESFQVHPVESSYAAFYMVSKEATERLLGLKSPEEFNIEW